MDLPIELQSAFLGRISDLATIIRLLQTCSSIQDLTRQSVRKIESDSPGRIPARVVRFFPRLEQILIPVVVTDFEDLELLAVAPALQKIRVELPRITWVPDGFCTSFVTAIECDDEIFIYFFEDPITDSEKINADNLGMWGVPSMKIPLVKKFLQRYYPDLQRILL